MVAPTKRLRIYALVALFAIPCAIWIAWFYAAWSPAHRLAGPRLVYWAWERAEDLRFLDPRAEGVAFLAATVELLPDAVHVQRRMQPLLLSPEIQVVAVVRVYSHPATPAALDQRQISQTLDELVAATQERDVTALQIDFDARESERVFYTQLLQALRAKLGPAYPISITALASWCMGDRWIHNLPVNEAVPMLFSMGKDEALMRHYLSAAGTFPEPLCRGSVGLSTGEPWPGLAGSRTRVYVFDPNAWDKAAADEFKAHLHRGI